MSKPAPPTSPKRRVAATPRRKVRITKQMVDEGARMYRVISVGFILRRHWDSLPDGVKEVYRDNVRTILRAALSSQRTTKPRRKM